MSMCRLSDTEGENRFLECSHKSCCTVERASYRCKSRRWEFSLTSATTPPCNHPPADEATTPSHGSPSPSISPCNLNFTRPAPAFRCCVSTLPVAGDFQSHYQGCGWEERIGTERGDSIAGRGGGIWAEMVQQLVTFTKILSDTVSCESCSFSPFASLRSSGHFFLMWHKETPKTGRQNRKWFVTSTSTCPISAFSSIITQIKTLIH